LQQTMISHLLQNFVEMGCGLGGERGAHLLSLGTSQACDACLDMCSKDCQRANWVFGWLEFSQEVTNGTGVERS